MLSLTNLHTVDGHKRLSGVSSTAGSSSLGSLLSMATQAGSTVSNPAPGGGATDSPSLPRGDSAGAASSNNSWSQYRDTKCSSESPIFLCLLFLLQLKIKKKKLTVHRISTL